MAVSNKSGHFLMRMAGWGLAGLSLYLLLPALQGFSPHGQVDFWTALKANLKSQKEILVCFRRPAFRALLVASLLPVVVLSIRWRSHSVQFGDDTRLGVFLTKTMVHLVHGLVFACSLWLALDPTFSPRHLGLGTPMLVYYYLSALVCGYCGGYFDGAVRRGDFATLIGGRASVDDLAAGMGTIGYEVLTHLGRRYHRVYKGG